MGDRDEKEKEIISEYLLFRGFLRTLRIFDSEYAKRRKYLGDGDPAEISGRIVEFIKRLDLDAIWCTWVLLENKYAHVLENGVRIRDKILRHYLASCFKRGEKEKIFQFFDDNAEKLTGSDWGVWYTLPFIESMDSVPAFRSVTCRDGLSNLEREVGKFLTEAISASPASISLEPVNTEQKDLFKEYKEITDRLSHLERENMELRSRRAEFVRRLGDFGGLPSEAQSSEQPAAQMDGEAARSGPDTPFSIKLADGYVPKSHALSPSGAFLVTLANRVEFIEYSQSKLFIAKFPPLGDSVSPAQIPKKLAMLDKVDPICFAFGPSDTTDSGERRDILFVGDNRQTIHVYRLHYKKVEAGSRYTVSTVLKLRIKGISEEFSITSIHPTGNKLILLLSVSAVDRLICYDVSNGMKQDIEYTLHGKLVTKLAYNHNKKLFIVGTLDGSVMLFDTNMKAPLFHWRAYENGPVNDAHFSADETEIITIGLGRSEVKVWKFLKKEIVLGREFSISFSGRRKKRRSWFKSYNMVEQSIISARNNLFCMNKNKLYHLKSDGTFRELLKDSVKKWELRYFEKRNWISFCTKEEIIIAPLAAYLRDET